MSILVIHDDRAVADALYDCLKDQGRTDVYAAYGLAYGLIAIENYRPDIVVYDALAYGLSNDGYQCVLVALTTEAIAAAQRGDCGAFLALIDRAQQSHDYVAVLDRHGPA